MTDQAHPLEERVDSGELSVVHHLADPFEAEPIRDAFQTESIDHEILLNADVSASFGFERQGVGVVIVRAQDGERARALIAEILAHDAEAAAQAVQDAESSIADEEGPVGS